MHFEVVEAAISLTSDLLNSFLYYFYAAIGFCLLITIPLEL